MTKKQEVQRELPTYYAIIPAEVRYCNDIPFGARMLFGEITALANKSGYCWASNDFFTKMFEVHQTTISEWVSLLKQKGFINFKVDKGNNRKITVLATIRKKPKQSKENSLRSDKEKDLYNNTSINNSINNTTNVEVIESFDSKQYLENMMNSSNRLYSIVGMFAYFKKKNFKDKKSADAFLYSGFNLKCAKELQSFEKDDIIKAMKKCDSYIINGRKVDWSLKAVINAINK